MKFLIILLVFLSSCKTNTENIVQKETATSTNPEHEWIRSKVDSVMKKNNIPAISVGLVRNGKLEFAEGFGHKNRKTKALVDEYSLYQIGSDTKKMTGIIVRNLVAEGKLDLNTSIIQYLPKRLDTKAKEKLKPITLLNVLHHKSGIPRVPPSIKRVDGNPMLIPYTEEDLIFDLNNITLDFEPGTEFRYSNLGYSVVGYICERSSGKTYNELIEKYIAQPYDMFSTTVIPSDKELKHLVTPYRKDNRNIETQRFRMGKAAPAGGVYSNVDDISKLMIHQINAYKNYKETGDLSNPLILTENSGVEGNDYGFGLGKQIFETGILYGHGGDLDGFGSTYHFSPEHDLGLIILTSSGGRWVELAKELIYKFTNREYVAPKESLAEALITQISEYGLDNAKAWLSEHRNSGNYVHNGEEVNNFGYSFLGQKKIAEALFIFQLNVDAFPESANAYDSLGEAYMLNGNNNLAVLNYRKSLELNTENENAIKMIEDIKNKI